MFNPYFAVVITTIIWGSAGVFIKYLNLPPATIAFFRMFVPAFILFVYFKIKKINPFRKDLKLILFVSSLGVVEMFLYFVAYKNTSIANSVVTLYTWPIFTAIFSAALLKEKIAKRNVVLLVVAFIGVGFVYFGSSLSFSDKDFVGITSMLIASVLFGLMITLFKKLSSNHTNFEIIFYHNFMGAVVFIPFLFANQFPTSTQSFVAITYGLLIGLLGYIPYYFGIKYIKASVFSILSYIEVVSGILFGIVLLHETLTSSIIFGGALITCSALLIKK